MKLVLTQQETIQAIQYYLVNHKNMEVSKVDIEYESFVQPEVNQTTEPVGVKRSNYPWVTPDKDGWYTHNPDWKDTEPPYYIVPTERVIVDLGKVGTNDDLAEHFNWSVDDRLGDIIKWKYAD